MENIKNVNMNEIMNDNFVSYANYTIEHRAIPDVRDGMKPIQRRILYAMSLHTGFASYNGRRKSAAMVGDVMGTFHPHGDSSIYDASTNMAVSFKNNHRLIDPKGNMGNIDGDQPAAMRYTEQRLEKFSEEVMLSDLSNAAVDFIDNYDGTTVEPVVLPVQIPYILINGIKGIATGWATNIPPHNLGEVLDGFSAFIDNNNITADEMMKYIPAPDFPTGGIINGTGGLPLLYRSGQGGLKLRGRFKTHQNINGEYEVVIYEVPYGTKPKEIISKCVKLNDLGVFKLKSVIDGAGNGVEVSIQLVFHKSENDLKRIEGILYAECGLEEGISANMIMLVDHIPVKLSVIGIFREFIKFRREVIFRRNKAEHAKNCARLHILEALLKIVPKEVVGIIENSDDVKSAAVNLMKHYKLSEIQADYILRMPLMRITKMEVKSTKAEHDKLITRNKILDSFLMNNGVNKTVDNFIKEQIANIKKKYAKPRRTEIRTNSDVIDTTRLIKPIPCMIVTTKNGYIKRLPLTQADMVQSRGGTGRNIPGVDIDDEVNEVIDCTQATELTLVTSTGKVYSKLAYHIDETNGVGRKIDSVFGLVNRESPVLFTSFSDDIKNVVLVLDNGQVKISKITYLRGAVDGEGGKKSNFKKGTRLMKLDNNEKLVAAVGLTDNPNDTDVIIASANGKAIRINTKEIRVSSNNAGAIKGMTLEGDDRVTSACSANTESVVIATSTGYAKLTEVSSFRVAGRGGRGVKITGANDDGEVLFVGNKKNGLLTLTTNKNKMLTFDLTSLSTSSKTAKGVKIASLDPDGYITKIN